MNIRSIIFKPYHFPLFSLLLGSVALLTGCSDDSVVPDTGNGDSDVSSSESVCLSLDLSVTGEETTRSTTTSGGGSSSGTVGAEQGESKLRDFVVTFLVNNGTGWAPAPDCSFVGTVEGNSIVFEVSPRIIWQNLAGKVVRVRLVTNGGYTDGNSAYTSDVAVTPFSEILDYVNLNDASKGFALPLANEYEFPVDLTKLTATNESDFNKLLFSLIHPTTRRLNLSTDVNLSADGSTAGELSLERGVARVDYRPYQWVKGSVNNTNNKQVFKVGEIDNLYARMYSLQLINVSRNAFTFRHVSQGDKSVGKRTGGAEIVLGDENSNSYFGKDDDYANGELTPDDWESFDYYSWISDTDWTDKTTWADITGWTGPTAGSDGSTYFLNQPTKSASEPFYFVHPTRVGGVDTYYGLQNVYDLSSFNSSDYSQRALNDNYLPLWYIGENTLPSVKSMKNGMSTGIAFRMVICNVDGDPLTADDFDENYVPVDSDEDGTPDVIKVKGTFSTAESPFSGYYKMKIGTQTVYLEQVSLPGGGTGYAMTYYYYFRHNYSGEDHTLGVTEPMQFAVVRNNVYKVCVTGLNGLPDPYVPDKDDEPSENFLAVETNILSWRVISDDNVGLNPVK